jgi:hypothetical protein
MTLVSLICINMAIQIKDTSENKVHIHLVSYTSEIKSCLPHKKLGPSPIKRISSPCFGLMVIFDPMLIQIKDMSINLVHIDLVSYASDIKS